MKIFLNRRIWAAVSVLLIGWIVYATVQGSHTHCELCPSPVTIVADGEDNTPHFYCDKCCIGILEMRLARQDK